MRTLITAALVWCTLLALNGCSKDNTRAVNCEKIRSGILNNDREAAKEEINRLTYFYTPDPAASDLYGHRLNIEDLVQKLNTGCNLSASLLCYDCIYTLPPQSEILVSVSTGSTTVSKAIDLSYTQNKRLIFVNMHD